MFSFFGKWSDFNDRFLLSSASAPSSVKSSKKYSSIILEFRSLPRAELSLVDQDLTDGSEEDNL